MAYTHNIGIQMNRKELTNTITMISNWFKAFGRHDIHKKYFSVVRVNGENTEQ